MFKKTHALQQELLLLSFRSLVFDHTGRPVVVMIEAVLRRSPMVPYSLLCDHTGRPVVVMIEAVLRRSPRVPYSLLCVVAKPV